MAATDPKRRAAAAAAGGRARIAQADPAAMTAARRAGGLKLHTPATLARRLRDLWPNLTTAEQAEVHETGLTALLTALLTADMEKGEPRKTRPTPLRTPVSRARPAKPPTPPAP